MYTVICQWPTRESVTATSGQPLDRDFKIWAMIAQTRTLQSFLKAQNMGQGSSRWIRTYFSFYLAVSHCHQLKVKEKKNPLVTELILKSRGIFIISKQTQGSKQLYSYYSLSLHITNAFFFIFHTNLILNFNLPNFAFSYASDFSSFTFSCVLGHGLLS